MPRRFIRRPSPSMVVASIALFVSMGGVSYAVATGSIDSREIKNNDVRGKDVRSSTLRGSDVGSNTLTGSDISESSLGSVPNANSAAFAANANNATNAVNAGNAQSVGGVRIVRFSLRGAAPLANREIAEINGLRILASCAGGAVTLTATTSVGDSEISAIVTDASAGTEAQAIDDTFNVGDTFTFPIATNTDLIGEGAYTGADGRSVRIEWNEEDATGTNNCLLHGYAIG